MAADLIIIGEFSDRLEAEVVKGLLASVNIPAWIASDDEGGTNAALGFATLIKLMVREEDAVKAQEILAAPPML